MRTCIQRVLNERREPSFRAVVIWFCSSPTPSSPLPSASCFSCSVFLHVSPVDLTHGRVREGVGAEPNNTTARKPTLLCLKTYFELHKEFISPGAFLYKVTLIVDRKVRQKYITYPRLSSSGGNVIVVKSNLQICQPPHVHRFAVPVRQADSHRCHQLLCSTSLSSTWISCRTNISFLSPSVL